MKCCNYYKGIAGTLLLSRENIRSFRCTVFVLKLIVAKKNTIIKTILLGFFVLVSHSRFYRRFSAEFNVFTTFPLNFAVYEIMLAYKITFTVQTTYDVFNYFFFSEDFASGRNASGAKITQNPLSPLWFFGICDRPFLKTR